MLLNLRKTATAAVAALSLGLALPAPAHAWGEKEQNMLAALAAAGLIGGLIYQNQRQRAVPVARAPIQTYPTYRSQNYYGQSRYVAPRYQAERYQAERYQAPGYYPSTNSVYQTPAARAFNSYTLSDRRAIQRRLANAGYYQGSIDGVFGPMTYRAITAISADSATRHQISTLNGAYEFYDAILRA